MSKSTREWVAWAKKHAKDIGDASLRHVERQDLLADRKKKLAQLGERVLDRLSDETHKTVSRATPGVGDLLAHVERIDSRLAELADIDSTEQANGG